jgi:hypothetical protein
VRRLRIGSASDEEERELAREVRLEEIRIMRVRMCLGKWRCVTCVHSKSLPPRVRVESLESLVFESYSAEAIIALFEGTIVTFSSRVRGEHSEQFGRCDRVIRCGTLASVDCNAPMNLSALSSCLSQL